jgi:isopentenyl diphosphate isomerase/L-lactate dehydrogenase-like FMN-dependent dehydrogenase
MVHPEVERGLVEAAGEEGFGTWYRKHSTSFPMFRASETNSTTTISGLDALNERHLKHAGQTRSSSFPVSTSHQSSPGEDSPTHHASQISISNNQPSNRLLFQLIDQSGAKAIVLTVDSAGDRTRQRALRDVPNTNIAHSTHFTYIPWPYYRELQNMTSLPIVLKGIQTVEDAHMATKVGAPAIFPSLHGGRGLMARHRQLKSRWRNQEKPGYLQAD